MRAYLGGTVPPMWTSYVRAVTRGTHNGEDPTQMQIAQRLGHAVHQTTVGRWLAGSNAPTNAADVAHFARSYDRNPLEAFVAAGMLTLDEAGQAIGTKERAFLRSLDGHASPESSNGPVLRAARRTGRKPSGRLDQDG